MRSLLSSPSRTRSNAVAPLTRSGDAPRGRNEPLVPALLPQPIYPARPPAGSWRIWRTRYVAALIVADAIAAGTALAAFLVIASHPDPVHVQLATHLLPNGVLLLLSVPIWLISLALAGAYRSAHAGRGMHDHRLPLVIGLASLACIATATWALRVDLSRDLLLVYFPVLLATTVALRGVVRRLLATARRRGLGIVRLVLVGSEPAVRKVADHLGRGVDHGFAIVGACVPSSATSLDTRHREVPVIGHPDDLVGAAQRLFADSVAVVGDGQFETVTLQRVAWELESSGIDLLVAPEVVDVAGPRIRVGPVTGLPILHITEPRLGRRGRRWKAIYEPLLCLPLVIPLLPLMGVIALVILVRSGRPVLYRQARVGEGGRVFTMIKFRTMVPEADTLLSSVAEMNEHDGALFKIRDDPRITPTGRFLRRYSLDELPQLFNVLRGNMVLVGPRPCLPREVDLFGEAARRRFRAKPGLTGLWQVSGRSDIPWDDAVRLDLYYVENWSPLLDLGILYRTIRVILRGGGC